MNSSVDHQDNWSSLTAKTALERFGSSGAGLSEANAVGRLAQFGLNRLPLAKRRSAVLRFLLQFHNVLLYVLLSASAVTASLGHWVDTWGDPCGGGDQCRRRFYPGGQGRTGHGRRSENAVAPGNRHTRRAPPRRRRRVGGAGGHCLSSIRGQGPCGPAPHSSKDATNRRSRADWRVGAGREEL
jgi:hypothetical protein